MTAPARQRLDVAIVAYGRACRDFGAHPGDKERQRMITALDVVQAAWPVETPPPDLVARKHARNLIDMYQGRNPRGDISESTLTAMAMRLLEKFVAYPLARDTAPPAEPRDCHHCNEQPPDRPCWWCGRPGTAPPQAEAAPSPEPIVKTKLGDVCMKCDRGTIVLACNECGQKYATKIERKDECDDRGSRL